MYRKISVLAVSLIIITLLAVYHESFLAWIHGQEGDHILLASVIATLMSLFPVIPYPIVGGVIGAAYGTVTGALIIWIGSTAASVLFFLMVRYGGFHKLGTKVLLKYPVTKKITLLFERNAFMSLTVLRMIPVIPSIVINAYAALSRVHFLLYSTASGLGKIPAMTLFAMIGHTIVTDPSELVYMAVIYGSFLAVVYTGYRYWTAKIQQTAVNNLPS
ncbi:TVP38/TMEM64 family protein [Salisediminibacterium halotolerans]|uniref:TVP38/TMEM64 family membrane protein n=1 Tax=Salisediminibacterium halotolerans TaxID=517425 RepID=A0A1H9RW97_9BACI|nr:VTT domain-containing protein [Salisediminibacterium haloalkalitolerans]SER77026.1 Uncharacterized membrane protein YdjX, TVP38/TMEM64 family, SNARE-associated domain [Salisediminibacterium haloalkalitolerans]